MGLLSLPVCTLVLFWTVFTSGSTSPFSMSDYSTKRSVCKPIPSTMGLCHNVGYREMRLPNLLGHDTLKEAQQQAGSWVPLVSKHCHRDTKKFLCSLFAPVCLSELLEPIRPCMSLCEGVRDGCVPVMSAFGFPWPEMLNCSQFPAGTELCIPPSGGSDDSLSENLDEKQEENIETLVCDACRSTGQDENEILQNYCKNDFAMRLKVRESMVEGEDRKIVGEGKSRMLLRKNNHAEEEEAILRSALWLPGGGKCTCDELSDTSDTLLALANRAGDRLVLSRVVRWQRGDKELRKLIRSIRKLQC